MGAKHCGGLKSMKGPCKLCYGESLWDDRSNRFNFNVSSPPRRATFYLRSIIFSLTAFLVKKKASGAE